MSVLGIVISLLLLMFIAFRGYSVILFAPVCAMAGVLLTGGGELLPTYTQIFMKGGMGFAAKYFPIFMLGAVFGKLIEETGLAKSISHYICTKLGTRGAILSVVLSCAILAYGGVSAFVVVFAVYPIGAGIFKEADIPKRLLPAALALGTITFAMTAIPGTPQIHNIIPTTYFKTDGYAAPVLGLVVGIGMLVFGMMWLERRRKKAALSGEGYGECHFNEPEKKEDEVFIKPALAFLPLLTVLVSYFVLTKYVLTKNMYDNLPADQMNELVSKYGEGFTNAAPIWSLIVAITLGIIMVIVIGHKNIGHGDKLKVALSAGVSGSLLAIMNTSSEVGYGTVIKSLAGFEHIKNGLMAIDFGTPLVSEAVSVNILAGITGSASGGMSIALASMGNQYYEWALQTGLNPELLHRVAALASGGLDSLPQNGAIITLLAICGLTHRQSYKDIFMVSVLIPFLCTFGAIALGTVFNLF
jgi:H+/gluconate symporter-like permease